MSYDLYFRSPGKQFPTAEVRTYFSKRPNFRIGSSYALYENRDTGVNFTFGLAAEGVEDPAVVLNINFCRPSFFGLEAEHAVTHFARKFEFTVQDPQKGGMGDGPYDPQKMLAGWNTGNALGCAALLGNASSVIRPSAELHRIWTWNWDRSTVQEAVERDIFIPKIVFLRVGQHVMSAVVWADAIPTSFPKVDVALVTRRELAPQDSRKSGDRCVVPWSEIAKVMTPFADPVITGCLSPIYEKAPAKVTHFVQSLTATKDELQFVLMDQVRDQELVDKRARG